jgi:hypothetical protein
MRNTKKTSPPHSGCRNLAYVDAEARGKDPKDYHLKKNLRENLKITLNIKILTREMVVSRLKNGYFCLYETS